MKKLLGTIIVLAIIAAIMFFTCPDYEKHVDKLTTEMVESAIGTQDGNEDPSILENLGNAIVGSLSESVVRVYVKSQLKVNDYYVLNLGKMRYDGETRVVTIGAFGHVFCLAKAYDLLEEME